ncbi:MAG: VOC family protein [Acidobacteria bacterium]|nr:VOC family protein [Acidobacteriota bacterium]
MMEQQTHKELPFGWMIIGLLALLAFLGSTTRANVSRVESVGFTVSDMERALDFYTRILPFEKVADDEVFGDNFERLTGVFGARARIIRLKLGDETLELTEYLTGGGRPVPVPAVSGRQRRDEMARSFAIRQAFPGNRPYRDRRRGH